MKDIQFVCEAQLKVDQNANESTAPSGMMEARVTTWGAREGADGRKFNYQPEGFKAWAEQFHAEGKPLPMFLNHNDMGMPVGEWYEFAFDDEGMTAKGKLFVNTNAGNDVYTVMKESPNLFGGVSVGAYAEEACWVDAEGNVLAMGDDTDEAYFQISKGGLREVSVVMYPNNPQAEVMKLEAFDAEGNPNPRVIEKVLRDAGLSRKDATTASSILKRIIKENQKVEVPSELVKPETVTVNNVNQETPSSSESDAVDMEAQLIAAMEMRELAKALSKRI
jgi:HK97 family phage prohead protease